MSLIESRAPRKGTLEPKIDAKALARYGKRTLCR